MWHKSNHQRDVCHHLQYIRKKDPIFKYQMATHVQFDYPYIRTLNLFLMQSKGGINRGKTCPKAKKGIIGQTPPIVYTVTYRSKCGNSLSHI